MKRKNDEAYVWQEFIEKMSAIYKEEGLTYTNILELVTNEVQLVFERGILFLQTYKEEEKRNEEEIYDPNAMIYEEIYDPNAMIYEEIYDPMKYKKEENKNEKV